MRFISIFVLIILSSGCITIYNPATGKKEYYFIPEEYEIELGRNLAHSIIKENKMVKDRDLNIYVRNIGKKIAQVCDRKDLEYHFYIIRSDKVNAFALPGGYVFVNSKLIEIADEGELAFVLGHEIGHICARHALKRLQSALGVQLLMSIALKNEPFQVKQAISIIYNLVSLGYSRQDEFLADTLGVKYMCRAGYSPYSAIRFLRKLEDEDKNFTLIFLRSHPPIKERIENIEKKINHLCS